MNRNNLRYRVLSLMLAAVFLLAGCSGTDTQDIKTEYLDPSNGPGLQYTTCVSTLGDFQINYSVRAQIVYLKQDYLYWRNTGDHYGPLSVKQGSRVKQGDVLAVIDVGVTDADILEAELSVTKAQQNLSSLSSTYQKNVSEAQAELAGLTGDAYSAKSLDISQMTAQYNRNYAASSYALAKAEQILSDLQERRSQTAITAPFDGIIVSVIADYEEGAAVSTQEPIFVIADVSSRAFTFENNNPNGKIPYLSKVSVIDVKGSSTYSGTVVSCAAVTGSSADTVIVQLDEEAPEDSFTGMVNIEGCLLKKESVVLVDSAALQTEGLNTYVLKLTDGHVVSKEYVSVGGQDGSVSWISEGVEPGETLIIS